MQIEINTRAFDYPHIKLPGVYTVRQKIEAPVLQDIEGATLAAVEGLLTDPRLRPGASVAIGVGSRGINNIVTILKAVIRELKEGGADPFIVPAMGSHGGATAEGQVAILRDYGITPETMEVPIQATMEVAKVGELEDGYPVYFDCNALDADAVIVVNRIKHHTDFAGEIESGLAKMCAIGLGKQKGADSIHRFGADGLRNTMPKVARKLLESVNIVGGVAILENQFGQTAEIHGVLADGVGREIEKNLLARARALAPRLPFESLDVLVVDYMGKDISGSGMDTHVIGRVRMPSIEESTWDGPNIRIVCVLDLTERSHGNAAGIGLADMTTRRLIEKIDFDVTYTNHRTSGEGGVLRGGLPIILDDAEMCVRAAIGSCGQGWHEKARLARIRNTEFVKVFEVSESMLEEVRARDDLEIVSDLHPLDLTRSPGS